MDNTTSTATTTINTTTSAATATTMLSTARSTTQCVLRATTSVPRTTSCVLEQRRTCYCDNYYERVKREVPLNHVQEPSGCHLEPFPGRLETNSEPSRGLCVGSFEAILEPSCGHLGTVLDPFWGHFFATLGHRGPPWGLGAMLAPSEGHFGAILGPSWCHLGAILGPS